jgi:hypothetical protein
MSVRCVLRYCIGYIKLTSLLHTSVVSLLYFAVENALSCEEGSKLLASGSSVAQSVVTRRPHTSLSVEYGHSVTVLSHQDLQAVNE